jgi:S-DNA-T family DNA segregation ATPase FtsK/SpoIIIE
VTVSGEDRGPGNKVRRGTGGGAAGRRRLVVSVDEGGSRADQLQLARPQLSWRGVTMPVTTAGVIIGRDGHGAITAREQERVHDLVEVVRRGADSWIRMRDDAVACSVAGEDLGRATRRLVAGDDIVVGGELFRFSASTAADIGPSSRAKPPAKRPPRVERLELRLSIEDASGHGGDLAIEAGADVQLLRVLLPAAEALRLSWSGASARCERLGELDLLRPVGSIGLWWGDRIALHARRVGSKVSPPVVDDARGGRIPVNRAPRIRRQAPSAEIELQAPPDDAGKPRFPLIASLLPLLAGIVMAVLLHNAIYLIFTALSPIMAVASYVSERRSGRDRYSERAARFRRDLSAADAALSAAYVSEAEYRFDSAPGLDVLLPRATGARSELWERHRTDDDFLVLRVGIGAVPFTPRVSFQRGGSEALRAEAHRHLDRFDRLDGVPVVADIAQLGVFGIAGPHGTANGVARGLIVQAALLHSPADLVVAAAVGHRQAATWRWMKWLPHVSEAADMLQGAPLANGDIAAAALLERIRQLQDTRLSTRDGRLGGERREPHLLVLIDGELEFDRSAATSVLDVCARSDVSVIWLADQQAALPSQTGAVMTMTSPQTFDLVFASSGQRFGDVRSERLGAAAASSTARVLAPLVDRGARRRATGVPTRVGLLELLGLEEVDSDAIEALWESAGGELVAPIGAGSAGAFKIDLRRDGPHALVVGTTGSGKSELLRSIVCALAALHPPTRVSFLLFDYKGGAAFGPCAGLPHVFDVVSDLDEHLSQRALIALDAELLRRERLLAEVGAKDMVDLARKFPQRTPPALVLAVDEFAKLRDEVPEFVDGVVDVAQRGRSLGVHMILASQTLGNAFTTPIRANTNLRLALRSADEAQSEDAIGSREAAHIPSGPEYSGRGFARIGLGRLSEFQTAYVSGRSDPQSANSVRVRPYELDGGHGEVAVTQVATEATSDEETDLERLVGAACAACEATGIQPPPAPWLPPLPPAIRLADLPPPPSAGAGIAIGLLDEPREQRQPALLFSPAHTGFMIAFGAGGSGRTTLLRTVAAAIAGSSSPDDAHMYVIDARGRGLTALCELPHCGAVISAGEEERIDRLLGRLVGLVDARARRFSEAGVSTLAEYRRLLPQERCPQVTLLIDDLDEFVRANESAGGAAQLQRLGRIASAGRQVGVSAMATAASRAGVGAALMTHVSRRLVLPMASPDDAIGLGVQSALARTVQPQPGRAFVDGVVEAQIAHIGQSPEGRDQIDAIRELAAWASQRWPGTAAPAVRTLPDAVALDELGRSRGLAELVIGIGGNDLLPIVVDLTEGHLLVSGARRSGRSMTLVALVHVLTALDQQVDVRVLAPRRSPLHRIPGAAAVASDASSCSASMTELAAIVAGRARGARGEPVIAIVDDAGDLSDSVFAQAAERVARYGPEVGVHLIVAVDRTTARGFTHPWVKVLASDGRGIVLAPEDASAADHLGGDLPRRSPVPRQAGRGYLVRDGSATLVQIATAPVAPAGTSH